jgi:histidine kinase
MTETTYSVENSEPLFSSSNTVILRAKRISDGLSVVIKKPAKNFSETFLTESFKKDYQFTKMLHKAYPDYFINMVEMLEQKNGSVHLVEEEGKELKHEKFSTEEFLKVAKDMAIAVSCAHSLQIIHRDIKVRNFVVSSGKTKLIDFGLAVVVSRKAPSVPCNTPIGTYGYMSPEQTGRISKNVDKRSDIYSLGISFYELLTGALPFSGDKLSVVHSHITKKLPNVPNTPKALNEVIQKMCAKNPSERYFSASGVVKDLEFIEKNFQNLPEDFVAGQQDTKEFQIPNKIYGREKEVSILKKAILSKNETNMALVSGYSGMGKSKLIEELSKDQNLSFTIGYGKFDQFNRSTPYSAFIRYFIS